MDVELTHGFTQLLYFLKFSPKFCFKTLCPIFFQCLLQNLPFFFLQILVYMSSIFLQNFYTDLLYLNVIVKVNLL